MKKVLFFIVAVLIGIINTGVTLITLMVTLPVGMVTSFIHNSIKELSIIKGFKASDDWIAARICRWADNIRIVQALLAPQPDTTLEDLEAELTHTVELAEDFDRLLDSLDSEDHYGNVDKIVKFLEEHPEDETIDERWEVKK